MPRRKPYLQDPEDVQDMITAAYRAGWSEGYGAGYNATSFEPRELPKGYRQTRRLAPKYEKIVRPKKRRKTAYQSAYSAAYKRLKKKHPRMAFGSLSKKAHAAARKKVK